MATDRGRVRIDVLGPIRAVDAAGRDVTPDGALQRRLLALLVLRRGRVVPVDTAIDALWPAAAPRDPVAALQNHVFRLRRGLPDGLISSVAEGYRLDPALVDLDADRLAAATATGASDPDAEAAAAVIDGVLVRWQGPAYPELADVDDGRAEAVRLDDLRTRAREARAERRLARGDTDGLVAELSALVDAQPGREAPVALLMAALEATGRRADALRAYDDFRRLLGDELGIEPSPALADRHAELLAGGAVPDATPGAPVASDETPARAASGHPPSHRRLPAPPTSLVGRDDLVAEVTERAGTHRVVTLVGPGGVGKTRLLLEAGHRLRAACPDRPVVLCQLATASRPTVVDVVADALGIDARPGVPLTDRIADLLGDAHVVLLLDNCEHVVGPAAELVERLVTTCPHVSVLATSRERLRVPGEQVCAVPTLPVGDDGAPAVQLFVDRARAVAPGFEPDEEARAGIAEIVRRLDGLPLAIELAAARLHTHDVTEVAAGLDHRFTLLSSGYRTSARHASLSAAVSWSFGLLDEPLQEVFTALSVFVGSFTAADAAAVCDTDTETATAALVQLVERSLVLRTSDRRYLLLETLRAFGAERLAATGDAERVGDRHARYQVAWAEDANRRLVEPGPRVLAEIDAALPELRAAIDWLLAHDDAELAGRLVASLLDYGIMRLRPDVLAWSERVAAADPEDRAPAASLVWVAAAYAAWMAGDVDESGVRSERALRVAERSGEPVPSEVATVCGNQGLFTGRLDEAVEWYERAIEAAAGDRAQLVFARGTELLARAYAADPTAGERAAELLAEVGDAVTAYAAYVWYCAGETVLEVDAEEARARYTHAVEVAEQANVSFVVGLAGASKASIDARTGDPAVAAEDFRRLITHWRRAGMWSPQWTMLRSIAILLARLGRPRDAAVLEGAVRRSGAGHLIFGADEVALRELGTQLAAALGDEEYDAARRAGSVLDGDAAVEHALRAL